ncbi:6-hydroxymethylpterin diphosphokinase MptE-like protein [uncultured Treponema sp.]|uniref:motility associated factor glycosyltransferase family protein n=1 Tax=uncultured Treponema sp. TaxID=162155 RepID=UPI0025E527D0|nr:6-hydroxymethylpterin diphosphokinase MptE-like protein [uncultured Treponema sp.]
MNAYSYYKIETAKDGNEIPFCRNTETGAEISLHSKYNPIREAQGFASTASDSCSFFIVLGLAGGYHISALLERFPESKILVLEKDEQSLTFLEQIPQVKELSKNSQVQFSTLTDISQKILESYKPALHGNLSILSLRQWENIFTEEAKAAREKITQAIKLLAQDFSVQSHFGKIWQKNILSNLSLAEKACSFNQIQKIAEKKKKAAVIAAGPSLDEQIYRLKENQNDYFIIATDTAFSALEKQKIKCDAVVSIDGQQVSHEHYMENLSADTLYAFDLCAATSAVRKVLKKSANFIFFESGHPLAQYASFFDGKHNFEHLNAGSGTVTIAAASLARKLGFSDDKIEFFGADFAYIGGKPYCRGTYLENQFYSKSNRFDGAEKLYTKIMFRTETKKLSENAITTEILEAYKDSLKDFMENSKNPDEKQNSSEEGKFSLKSFKSKYCNELKQAFKNEREIDEKSYALMTLLPLIAKMGKDKAFIAYLKTLSYTERV